MTKFRCIVYHSTGNFIPYSGISYACASAAFDTYQPTATTKVMIERDDGEGWYNAVSYTPGRV